APAVLLLLIPSAGLALEWAGCAAWLGLVWLALALVWREHGAFSGFQVALALAAVFVGVAWVNAREPQPTSVVGYFEPAALHVYAVALGLLGLAWVAARHALRHNDTARELWAAQTWSAERVVLATVVVFQLVLAIGAVLPEVREELLPVGWAAVRWETPAPAQTFGPGAWLALGVLAVALLASFRFTGGQCDTDAHLVGLLLLFL